MTRTAGALVLEALLAACSVGGVIQPTPGSSITVTADAVTFSYPSAWWRTAWDRRGSFTYMAAAVSNQPLRTPCSSYASGWTCGQPVDQMRAGTVLVEWWENGFPTWRFDQQPGSQVVLDGLNARLEDPAGFEDGCTNIGADSALEVVVDRGSSNYFAFWACFKGPGVQSEKAQALAIMNSVHFRR